MTIKSVTRSSSTTKTNNHLFCPCCAAYNLAQKPSYRHFGGRPTAIVVTIVQNNLFKQIHFELVIFIIQHPSLDGKNVASWLDKLCHIKWKSRTTTFYQGCLSLRSHHMDIWESNLCKQILQNPDPGFYLSWSL